MATATNFDDAIAAMRHREKVKDGQPRYRCNNCQRHAITIKEEPSANPPWIAYCHRCEQSAFEQVMAEADEPSPSWAPARPTAKPEELAVTVPAPLTWPKGWEPITEEVYNAVRDARIARGAGYMPRLETLRLFDVREKRLGVGSSEGFVYNDKRHRAFLGFPYWYGGRLHNIKVLKNPATKEYSQDAINTPCAQDVLFGLDVLLRPSADITSADQMPEGFGSFNRHIFLCEGEWDTLAVAETGFTALGRLNAKGKIASDIRQLIQLSAEHVFILADNDEPDAKGNRVGLDGAIALRNSLPGSHIIEMPGELKDPCKVFAAIGKSAFSTALLNFAEGKAALTQSAKQVLGFPEPRAEAFYGLAADFANRVAPQSEVMPFTLLANFLIAAGVLFGRNAYALVEEKRHYPVEYLLMIGETGRSRKGTASNRVLRVFDAVEPGFTEKRVINGLSSAEGLLQFLQPEEDEAEEEKQADEIFAPAPARTSQSYLIFLEEFSHLLAIMKREGNALSSTIREAWDCPPVFRVLTRNNPLEVPNTNLSFIAHVTNKELVAKMDDTEQANGFANRYLPIVVRRSQELPFGGESVNTSDLVTRLHKAVESAQGRGRVDFDAEGRELWAYEYSRLTRERQGIGGALCGRAEAHSLRLSLLYALLDGSDAIRPVHIRAAIAFWDYCEASIAYVFRTTKSTGDKNHDRIMTALSSGSLTTDEISRSAFSKNKPKEWVDSQLAQMEQLGLVMRTTVERKNKKNLPGWAVR